jgi:LuxR family maltose regulon positive regulatory protein
VGPVNHLSEVVTPVSKLRPPRVRHAEITRHRILAHDRLGTCDVIAVRAPAGYGKSTLAIQWASRSDKPTVWISLDKSDSDPLVLLNTLAAALRHTIPTFRPPDQRITAEEPAFSHHILPRFLAAVAAVDSPLTIVVDDLHQINGAAARRILTSFTDSLPPGSQAAFLGRSLSAIPLPLWRGQGRVVELSTGDLRFTEEEAEQAIRAFHGTSAVSEVMSVTHGWPVAVYLLAKDASNQRMDDVTEFIESEVLPSLRPELREFVISTAALGAVDRWLAEAVTTNSRAARLLREALGAVLLAASDDGWYTYHPLLQDVARTALQRDDPGRLSRLYADAALWHLGQGHTEAAVRFALACSDAAVTGRVIWQVAYVALLHGRTQTVRGWLEQIGPETIATMPELSMTASWANVAACDYGHVLRHADQTVALMPSDWLEHPADFPIGVPLTLLLALTHRGLNSAREAVELARISANLVAPTDALAPLACLVLAMNLALVGDPEADQAFQDAIAMAHASGISTTEIEGLCVSGLWLIGLGRDAAGYERLASAVDMFKLHDLGQMSSTAAFVALARVALANRGGASREVHLRVRENVTLNQEIQKILPWFRPLSAAVLAFAGAQVGDFVSYEQHASWYANEGLCGLWAAKAEQAKSARGPLSLLTPAEQRVWDLLRGRMTLSEIAGALFLSRETVKSHTSSIYRKLGVTSRRELQDLAEASA